MTRGSQLTCIACGRDAGYNRAVVDTLADELVGGLCLDCERDSYGTDLNRSVAGDPDCTFCDHDGFVALPKWRVRRGSTSVRSDELTVGYEVSVGTTRLCDGHFHELARAIESATPGTPDGREPYERP